jgi:alanyl-tRNA synthetase
LSVKQLIHPLVALSATLAILACLTCFLQVLAELLHLIGVELTEVVRAGDLIREFSQRLGGKGGGRADMAQGGGVDVEALNDVLDAVPAWVDTQLP